MRSIFLFLSAVLPYVDGASHIVYKSGSSYCTGNLTGLYVSSLGCPNGVCTYSSVAEIRGQVNATRDFPKIMKVKVTPTIPHASWGTFFSVSNLEVKASDLCYATNDTSRPVLMSPYGNDAWYSCPEAGLYNFDIWYELWGDPWAWYADFYGFNIGLWIRIEDNATHALYSTCYSEMMVLDSDQGYNFSWSIVGGASILTGLAAGLMYRKRKLLSLEEKQEEEATGRFELIQDIARC